MKSKIYLFIGVISLFILSCKKPPQACIEISATNVNAGTEIEFSSCSEHALSFEWFMEGPEGAPENSLGWSDEYFVHSFSVPGQYTVIFTAYEKFSFLGDSETVEASITVH